MLPVESNLAADIHLLAKASSFKHLAIDEVLTASGNTDLVDAVAGKRIAVLGLVFMVTSGNQTFQLRSSTTKNLMGRLPVSTVVPHVWPPSPYPYVVTNSGEPLNLKMTAGVGSQTGCLIYAVVN